MQFIIQSLSKLQAFWFWCYFIYYFNFNSFKYNRKILNFRYLININMLILTMYSEFSDYIITDSKNQMKNFKLYPSLYV